VRFTGVNINDITDRLTLRVASVNNLDAQRAAQTGVLQIKALSSDEWNINAPLTMRKPVLARLDGNLDIPITIWDDTIPVTILTPGRAFNTRLQTNNSEHWYCVTVPSFGNLTVYTESSMDTEMWLYNESLTQLQYDDDGGSNSNARISRNVLGGTLYVRVSGYNGSTGSYSIQFSTQPISVTNITPGRSLNATLQANTTHWYRVVVPSAGNLIAYTESSIDTEMWLYNETVTQLEYNDDGGSNSNARISRNVNAGTYYIAVRGYSGRAGSYSLHVSTGT
jgi:hypothetical protein